MKLQLSRDFILKCHRSMPHSAKSELDARTGLISKKIPAADKLV